MLFQYPELTDWVFNPPSDFLEEDYLQVAGLTRDFLPVADQVDLTASAATTAGQGSFIISDLDATVELFAGSAATSGGASGLIRTGNGNLYPLRATVAGSGSWVSGVDVTGAGSVAAQAGTLTGGGDRGVQSLPTTMLAIRATASGSGGINNFIVWTGTGSLGAGRAVTSAVAGATYLPWQEITSLYVLPEVPGCPSFRAERAMRDAAIEFCIATDVFYPQELVAVDVQAGLSVYDLTPPKYTNVNHLLALYRQSGESYERLEPTGLMDIYQMSEGTPYYYAQSDYDTVVLGPDPVDDETLYAMYSLKPSSDSPGLPSHIALEYREALVHGTLYRLLQMNNQPWTNYSDAAFHKKMFERAIVQTARKVKSSWVGGKTRVVPRAFV